MSTPAPAGPGTPWDARYASQDYFYGTAPNDFLAAHAGMIDGPVLSLAEGEGRNAVFLARRGLQVRGVDSSAVGLASEGRASTTDQIKELMSGNLCRCGAYSNIRDAIEEALPACRQRAGHGGEQ